MIIGLYDEDMAKYTHVPINLEIAKLSTYYKGKREIVRLSPTFNPERFSKFILRKDYYDGTFQSDLANYKNLEYGGYAFSNGLYIPLDEEIEQCKPDKDLYWLYYKSFSDNRTHNRMFKTMLNAEHLRLSLNDKTIWENFEKQIQIDWRTYILIFHDYDLNQIDGAIEQIKELTSRMSNQEFGGRVGMKFPVHPLNSQQLINWADLKPSGDFFSIRYDGVIEDEAVIELMAKTKHTGFFRQLDYHITSHFKNEEEFVKAIPQIYRQVIFLRSDLTRFSLYYDEDFFINPEWCRVIDLINCFVHHRADYGKYTGPTFDSMYNFARALKEKDIYHIYPFEKEDARQIFRFVRQKSPELFDAFYDTERVVLKGGRFVDE